MSDCPFCSIPKHTSEAVLARNEHCYLVANPEGELRHGMMVVPFRHGETPFDFTTEEWAALQPLVNRAREILADHRPDGFNLGWNVGKVGGQEVMHVHLHIFARFADEPYAGNGIRTWLKSAENQRLM